jgi:hypothetical protein
VTLRRLAIAVLLVCFALLCLIPPAWLVLLIEYGGRVYLDGPGTATTTIRIDQGIQVRVIGVSPDFDGDHRSLVLLPMAAAVPPLLWLLARRKATSQAPVDRRLDTACRAAPAVMFVDTMILHPWVVGTCFLPLALVVLVIIGASRLSHAIIHRHEDRATRRLRAGLCPTCTYDIRATPHRCPECGTDLSLFPLPVARPR